MSHYMPQKGGAEAATARLGSISDYVAATRDRRQVSRGHREQPATNQTGEMIAQLGAYALDLGRQPLERGLAGLALLSRDTYDRLAAVDAGAAGDFVSAMRKIVTIRPDVRFRHTDDGLQLQNADGTPAKVVDSLNTTTVRGDDGRLHIVHLKASELVQALDPKATRIALGMDQDTGIQGAMNYSRGLTRAVSMNMTSSPEFWRTSLFRDGAQLLAEGYKINGAKGIKDAGGTFLSALADSTLALAEWGAHKATFGAREQSTRATAVARHYDQAGLDALKAKAPADFAGGGKHQYFEEFFGARVTTTSPDAIQTRSGLETALLSDRNVALRALDKTKEGVAAFVQGARTPHEVLEYGVRYGHYVAARKSGMPPNEAAQFSINQIDFMQKSEVGQALTSILPFAQTALNGAHAMVQHRIWKEGRKPVEFVKQPDGTYKETLATGAAGEINALEVTGAALKGLSVATVATAVLPSTLLMWLAQGMGGDDENGVSNYRKVDADVTAHNMLIPIGGGQFSKVPYQDGIMGLLGGLTVTLTRAAQGHFSANEAARVAYNVIRRHTLSFGRSDISEDDLRKTGQSGIMAGLSAAFMAQAHGLTPGAIAPIVGAKSNRDSFGNVSGQAYDPRTGGYREIPASRRNMLDKTYADIAAHAKAEYGIDVSATMVKAQVETLAQLVPFGLNLASSVRNSDRVESSRDVDALSVDGTPGWLKYAVRAAVRPDTSANGYDYRQYKEFVDDFITPLHVMRRGAAELDKVDNSYTSVKGKKAAGSAMDAFDAKHPELAEFNKVEGARREIARDLNVLYRKATAEGDNARLAEINKARAEIGMRALNAMHAIKDGNVGQAKKLQESFKSLVPR
jgi:hypothetical protein